MYWYLGDASDSYEAKQEAWLLLWRISECIDLLTIYISKQSLNGPERQSNKLFPEAAINRFKSSVNLGVATKVNINVFILNKNWFWF